MKKQQNILLLMLLGLTFVYFIASFQKQSQGPLAHREPGRYLELGKTNIAPNAKTQNESSVVFNDPAISSKWDLQKTDAEKAWQVSQGSRHIVVAIIDTGCDVRHEDLSNNIWQNPGEIGNDSEGRNKATNGIDDDGNGFIDDLYGWNFVNNNNDLTDNHGHGTHIAGIVGAEGGNGKGIIGIAPKVSMMILKYYDPKTPTDNLRNTVQAIHYATKMRANIINYSGGGLEFSEEEKKAIQEAQRRGILFVAAAGNERSNSDHHKYFPADYGLSNIISVTAIDPNTQVLPSSNYGVETVQIAAPGQNILSTLPRNTYGFMTGTSQATAFVTGAAAVVMAHKGTFSVDETKKYLLATGDGEETLINKTGTSRKLNLYKALTVLDSGIGATGVQAANITADAPVFSHESEMFNSEERGKRNPAKLGESASGMSGFGKSLLEAVQKKPSNQK
ncbi:MAG: hypothetical protein RJB66_172 [Pseudomonadota bacterium]|jgi:subtilisin family serine protease